MISTRVTRTYLAVPAHRRRLVESAAASPADAVFLDLEDAVPAEEKEAALEAGAEALDGLDWGSKTVAVRLNAIDSQTIVAEIQRLGPLPRLDAVILPKAERASDVVDIARRLREAGAGREKRVEIELLIETALGMVNVETLAASHADVAALHLGVGDFAASIGARAVEIGISPASYRHVGGADDEYRSTPLDLFAYPMMRLLVAARAFGLRAIDGPCGSFRDLIATTSTAVKAAAMGFDGKQVIHPTQIEATRAAFVPGPEEVAHARRIKAALDEAAVSGKGAVTVDGKMIDLVNARMVSRILCLAGEDA
jgi:malyl-CoA/(S)-citramalyl-CoA lyase